MKSNMLTRDYIKIEEGKITTLVGERCCGMSSLLCGYANEYLKNNDGKILILSNNMMGAMSLRSSLLFLGNDKSRIECKTTTDLLTGLVNKRYGMIIFDAPNIFDIENLSNMMLLRSQLKSKIIVGVTWENIAFDKRVNKIIKSHFTNRSDYAYYISPTWAGPMIYEIENTLCEDIKNEFLEKLWK